MSWRSALVLLAAALLALGACGPRGLSEDEVERSIAAAIGAIPTVTPVPTPSPVPTDTPTPKPTPTPDTEREAMLVFTREALQIEAERAELMQYLAAVYNSPGGISAYPWISGRVFSGGVTAGELNPSPTHDLQGVPSLQERLLLLDSPQSLQAVKESLASIYAAEIEWQGAGRGIHARVTKDNLEYWKQMQAENRNVQLGIDTRWGRLQYFRRDVYLRWAQILRDHGIDPAKEGFTALVRQ